MPQTKIEWKISQEPVPYNIALEFMENRVKEIQDGVSSEMVWLLQHPPIYTMGTSAVESDIVDPHDIEIIKTGRGGKITYHGPGQRVIYLMLDLKRQGRDVREFVRKVEGWVIDSLAILGVKGNIRDGRVGVWVDIPQSDNSIREEKIAAIGLRIRRWVSFHGAAINVAPNLEHFGGIIPCGISPDEFGVTSLKKLGITSDMNLLDNALRQCFGKWFEE